jgi:hypothetical protein
MLARMLVPKRSQTTRTAERWWGVNEAKKRNRSEDGFFAFFRVPAGKFGRTRESMRNRRLDHNCWAHVPMSVGDELPKQANWNRFGTRPRELSEWNSLLDYLKNPVHCCGYI